MKGLTGAVNRIYGSEKGRWALSALLCVLLVLLSRLLQTPTFYDNDDLNIAWALAGYRSGTPSFSHPFINCITGAAVSGLYTLFPRVPWWYAVQLLAMALGVLSVFNALLRIASRRGLPVYAPILAIVLLSGGLFYYPLTLVTFTLSSTVAGCGAVAMLLALDMDDGQSVRRRYILCAMLLLIVCLLIRQSSGLALSCFFFAALFYRFLGDGKTGRKTVLLTAAVAVASVALLTGVNGWGREHLNEPDFSAFDEARASYMDYPHDAYYENNALYEAQGWDGTLYELVNAWCYMDKRVNADSLNALSEGSAFAQMTAGERMRLGADTMGAFLGKYPLAVYWMTLLGCAFLLLLLATRFRKDGWRVLLTGGGVLLGTFALLYYLSYMGRMNLRTQMTVVYPAIVSLLLLAGTGWSKGERKDGGKRLPVLLCGGVIGLIMLFCGYRVFRTVVSYESAELLADAHTLTDYALAHPENVYIREVYAANNVDALTVYPAQKPTNLMDWGGCDTLTAARRDQLAINGLTGFDADVFLQDNVYFVTTAEGPYLELLSQLMADRWQAASYQIVDTLDNGCIIVSFGEGGAERP